MATNPDRVSLRDEILAGTTKADWSIVDGLVLHKGCVFVPSFSTL